NRCFDSDQNSAALAQSENSASKPEDFRLSRVLAFVRRGRTYELGSIRGAGQPRCPELRNRKILQRGLAFVFSSTFGEWQGDSNSPNARSERANSKKLFLVCSSVMF